VYSYIARQPILDANKQLIAYELLFRDGESNSFPDIDPDQATSSILSNNQLTLGVEQITGNLPAFINFHTDSLIKRFPSFLDPARVVIEVLEDVDISNELVDTCKQLKAKGYQLALDDYDFDGKWDLLFPYIDMIKIDINEFSMLDISRFANNFVSKHITLLAEKVETAQQFEQLKLLGFTLFQGYFFAKPELMKQRKISITKQNILELISQSSQEKLDIDAISDIFSGDPGLTYKLLRFINSPAYGRSQKITSLKHALIYIGELELKKFIALLALSDLSEGKPNEIMRLSLVRAKFCEQIALARQDPENPPKAFLTGILSLIDGILDHSIQTVIDILPVHDEIKSALLNENNYLAKYITLIQFMEQGQWLAGEALAAKLGIGNEVCYQAHQEALTWADEMLAC